jgi:hypothetical protein
MSTVGQHGGATVVESGTPVTVFTPVTMLPIRAAGRPPIKTVMLPIVIAPVQTGPATASPTQAAGSPPIMTVGAPGATIKSPVTVMSVSLAAKGINISCLSSRALELD